MIDNKYNLAIVCGRFQPFHIGYETIVRHALTLANKVGLFIGSVNHSGTMNNPFTYEERKDWIEEIFKKEVEEGRLMICPLYDRENPCDDLSWGKYYKEQIEKNLPSSVYGKVDLFVYGNDKVRSQWFTEEDLMGIDELIVNRSTIAISGTEIRKAIMAWDKETFQKFMNPILVGEFDDMYRKILIVKAKNIRGN